MSGETEASVSGWTVDTIREHFGQKLADAKESLRQEITDQRDFTRQQIADLRDSGRVMTVDLRDSIRTQAEDHRRMLDERYATQTKALDAAFKAAEQAVAVALANAEKATGKAETAAERRFESVNEFRQALTDQTATFIPRAEYEASNKVLTSSVSIANDRAAALELRLTSRLDTSAGERSGGNAMRTEGQQLKTQATSSTVMVLVAIATFVSVVSLVLSVVLHSAHP